METLEFTLIYKYNINSTNDNICKKIISSNSKNLFKVRLLNILINIWTKNSTNFQPNEEQYNITVTKNKQTNKKQKQKQNKTTNKTKTKQNKTKKTKPATLWVAILWVLWRPLPTGNSNHYFDTYLSFLFISLFSLMSANFSLISFAFFCSLRLTAGLWTSPSSNVTSSLKFNCSAASAADIELLGFVSFLAGDFPSSRGGRPSFARILLQIINQTKLCINWK